MILKCTGMQSILNGFLRQRVTPRAELLKAVETAGDHREPESLVISCIDSRTLSSRFLQTSHGDVLLSRNPGNLIPNYSNLDSNTPRDIEAAIELACTHSNINSLVICGHSDCKAMNLVHANRDSNEKSTLEKDGALKTWLMSNSQQTISKFLELEKNNFKSKLTFKISEKQSFEAFIDPENKFEPHDKFSQLNTLTQLESLKNFGFLNKQLLNGTINAFAMWLDIYTGDVYVFSYEEKCFVKLSEGSHARLAKSLEF